MTNFFDIFFDIMMLNLILLLILFICSLVAPLIHVHFFSNQKNSNKIPEIMLKYSLFFNVGCLFFLGFVGQLLYSNEIASILKWSWSPFQYELCFSELSLALLGLSCSLFNHHFWLATIIGSSIWLFGASVVQIYYNIFYHIPLIANGAFVIYWNIFISFWLILLYILYFKSTKRSLNQWLIS